MLFRKSQKTMEIIPFAVESHSVLRDDSMMAILWKKTKKTNVNKNIDHEYFI